MRYSIMLQLVGFLTLVLLGVAALFAWLQNRSEWERTAISDLLDAVIEVDGSQ